MGQSCVPFLVHTIKVQKKHMLTIQVNAPGVVLQFKKEIHDQLDVKVWPVGFGDVPNVVGLCKGECVPGEVLVLDDVL